jgi:hypothetical protein
VRVPLVLRLLVRPPELPRVAGDKNVALARVAEAPLANAGQVGEAEDIGLDGGALLGAERRTDRDALVLGDVLAALLLVIAADLS